jgi:hypothetical protein
LQEEIFCASRKNARQNLDSPGASATIEGRRQRAPTEIGASRRRSLRKTIKLERKCVHRRDGRAITVRAGAVLHASLLGGPDQIPHERAPGGVAPM